MFNFGVHGWTSFQSVQNYFYLLKYLHPDFLIIQHNHNEGQFKRFFSENDVEYYPEIRPFERTFVRWSRFYKLVKFTYLLTYNSIHYDEAIRYYTIIDGDTDYPMPARISAYINDKDPGALIPLYFERDFINRTYPTRGITREFLLTENYESLIRYARADGAEVILMTQYQNFSEAARGKYSTPVDFKETATRMNEESREVNDIIRKISEKNSVPLVDQDRDMAECDYLLNNEEVHYVEEGIQIKGQLVGAQVWELIKAKYNLTEDSNGSQTARSPCVVLREYLSSSQISQIAETKYFPNLAEIKEIRSSSELPVAHATEEILVVDDFEHGDLNFYVQDTQKAEMDYEIHDTAGIKGRGLKIHYQFDPLGDHMSADLARKFIENEGIQDWLAYDYLNFAFKVQNRTDVLRVVIVESDGDWWNVINNEFFEADRWYLVKVPLRGMFVLEDFSIQGDGVQDLSSVAELRFVFDSTNSKPNPTENTVYIDEVFLSG